MMGQIFHESYGTLIWLDSLSTDSSFAISFQTYWSTIPQNTDQEETYRLFQIFLYGPEQWKNRKGRALLRQDFISLFDHGYWRRLWVVQEIILSQRIYVVLGRATLNLDVIFESLDHTIEEIFNDIYLYYCLTGLQWHRSQVLDRTYAPDLLELACEYRAHYCQDVRDKVYGLLGLVSDNDRITVDYKCDVVTLLTKTLKFRTEEDPRLRREDVRMYEVQRLMRALNVYSSTISEHPDQESIAQTPVDYFRIAMVPSIVYIMSSHQDESRFSRLIQATASSLDANDYVDRHSSRFHRELMIEIYNLKHPDSGARYLLCALTGSKFSTLLRISSITNDIVLIGTIDSTEIPNTEGTLLTPCSMPFFSLNHINIGLSKSGTESRRAAFEQKVEGSGYIVKCGTNELIHLQGSHDRLDPLIDLES